MLEASRQSLPPILDYATALDRKHFPAGGCIKTGRLKFAHGSGGRFLEMDYGNTCYLTASVLTPDKKDEPIEITNNIPYSTREHMSYRRANQDENDVLYLLQTEQPWSKVAPHCEFTSDIISVYHTALPPGSHIFKKSLFNSEPCNLHRLECAIVELPHAGTGVGIIYDKNHDGNPDLPAAFVGCSQVISQVMEGHRLGLRDHGSEIDPATKKPYFKEAETPKFVFNDVTGNVYFESSDEEGLKGQDQVPSMTRAESKAMNAGDPLEIDSEPRASCLR